MTGLGEVQRRFITRGLLVVAAGAFLLCFNSYGLRLFPAKTFVLAPAMLRPWSDGKGSGYACEFTHSEGDDRDNPRSDTLLTEDGRPLKWRLRAGLHNELLGAGTWLHDSHAIVFTASDDSDPRTNGRRYVLQSPRLYTRAIGLGAALLLGLSVAGLYWLHYRPTAAAAGPGMGSEAKVWPRYLLITSALFLTGLYLNTGTLAPYANTHANLVHRSTGYLYNLDHPEYQKLFAFVDGQDRGAWEKALLLRRILFPTLAWPFMKLAGFETGGVIAGILLNLIGFLVAAELVRRQTGMRGGIIALWLMALYPGAAYWAGLPYVYTMIVPSSLLLLQAVDQLDRANGRRLVLVSFLMGLAYLGYDLFLFFLPASLLVLAWRRRPGAAVLSAGLQLLPLAAWMVYLTKVLHLPGDNSNSGTYGVILRSYFAVQDYSAWWSLAANSAHIALDVFFGASFIFLPALFLLVVAINPLTSRVALRPAESALLLSVLAVFLFINMAPAHESGWQMRGTWIARLYQPVFPVLIVFVARWWQQLPAGQRRVRQGLGAVVGLALLGNALVIFGPILNNPAGISETAFYRFYNHTDTHWIYEHCLRTYGRRPLGFPETWPKK